MRAFAAVFAREIFERKLAFLVAFAAGFVPLIGSLLYGWSSPDAAEGRVLVAVVGATALSAAFAILLGGTAIVGETKEKRISFYFSRPIPSGAIWGGKLLAAVFVTFATVFLAFTPGWLSGTGPARRLWGFEATPGWTALAALLLSVVLVLGSHAVVTVARLRSPWVALDLVLAPTLVFLSAVFLRSLRKNTWGFLIESFDRDVLGTALVALVLGVFLALLAATFVQVAEGRTDARRAHGAFSVVFFGVCGLAVALLGAWAGWCASATATDLVTVRGGVETAPRGPWVAVAGPLRAWRGAGAFLFDTTGGRSLRQHGYRAVFSRDGTRTAWGEPRFGFFERKDNRLDLVVADLATGRPVATGLDTEGWAVLALSPSGRRLAIRDGRTLSAYDVSDPANPKQLAAFTLAEDARAVAFVGEDAIRLFPRFYNTARRQDIAPAALEIAELSLPSKKFLVTGRFEGGTLPYLRLSADGRFLVGSRRLDDAPMPAWAVTLHDGRSGALLATLASELRNAQVRFLSENRIAVTGIAGAKGRLLFFEGEKGWGAPTRMVDLGPAKRAALGGEIAPGRVAVSLLPLEENPLPASRRAAKLLFVDAATGAVSLLGDGLVPADRMGWWSNPVLPPAEAGSPASFLFLDASDRLVRLDPATGARTVLVGKGK